MELLPMLKSFGGSEPTVPVFIGAAPRLEVLRLQEMRILLEERSIPKKQGDKSILEPLILNVVMPCHGTTPEEELCPRVVAVPSPEAS
jgi:hypothetical protein